MREGTNILPVNSMGPASQGRLGNADLPYMNSVNSEKCFPSIRVFFSQHGVGRENQLMAEGRVILLSSAADADPFSGGQIIACQLYAAVMRKLGADAFSAVRNDEKLCPSLKIMPKGLSLGR